MYDALMLAAIVHELNERLLDGRVQRVLLLDPLTIGLEVYAEGARHQLLASADARQPRLHLVGDADGAGRLTGDAATVTPLLLLLRKYVRGARLVRIYQQPPLERVAFLRFAKFVPLGGWRADAPDEGAEGEADEPIDGELLETTLAVEIMGRHSNLILIDGAGAIVDSAKRVPSRLSRVRPILPRLPYAPVPPQEKADPQRVTPRELAAILGTADNVALHQALVGGLRSISPQVAKEIAFRATGSIRTGTREALGREEAIGRALAEVLAPLQTGAWSPRLYLRATPTAEGGEPVRLPVAFSPFPLYHLANAADLTEERIAGPSALVERFFGATARAQAHAQRKEALAAAIRQERERIAAREQALLGEAKRAEEAERWRRWGETIYAYAWSLERGQRELVADGLTVPLDPAKTPSENAQEYFERYRKAQSAAANLPALLEDARLDGRYLDQLLTLLHLAERFDQIAAIAREWQDWRDGRHRQQERPAGAAGAKHGKRASKGQGSKQAAGRPQVLRARGGHQLFIGHTGPQNDAVTFDIASPDDTWLHSRGVPGSHVIVKWAGGRTDETVLQAAAELAAYYSGGRESGRVEVDHAARRDVRKIKGAGPGMVTYRNERTVRVAPRSEDELRRAGVIE